MRTDCNIVAQRHPALEDAADIDRYVAAAGERTADVDARWIRECHSSVEKRVRLDPLITPLQLGEIALAVDAQCFGDARRARRRHRHAVAYRESNHIGQEIFAARIAIVDRRQPMREGRGRRRHDAGVDFAYRLLLEARILVLDDRGNTPVGGANDAAVSRRIVEVDREQRQGAPLRVLDDFPQSRFARQRIGPEHHQRHAVGRERGKGAAQCVAGAARRILPRPDKIGIGKARAQGVAGAVDDADRTRGHGPCGREHVREQGLPAERMQDFGQRGMHALTLPCGKDRDLQWFHDNGIIAFLPGGGRSLAQRRQVLALPIGLLAAHNLCPSTAVNWFAGLILVSSRSVNSLVWGLLFVGIFGPGALAGTLAIACRSIGFVGKLFGEALEETSRGPIEALDAAGAPALSRLSFGYWPQVKPAFWSIALFRWDINVRESAVLGLVGAGGIGMALDAALNLFQWDRVAVILLAIMAIVIVAEIVVTQVRRRVI